ncbi:hypothetical protein [Flavobacterium hungaricum]|uniref:Lipoprotein n=1 Tax=Flavobacterium hungaricum TaxID=2082725 RepID=A0ABR9TN95_9FLAO|nr:hypothetical protein [Flavobacterium hungaricum]MBE8726790.1 hypothetical protein [Flavobacterium hungaricum]
MTKKALLFLLFTSIVACTSTREKKEASNKIRKEYVDFVVSRGLDTLKTKHYHDFVEFKEEQKRKELINNPYLKLNHVYTFHHYTRGQEVGTFIEKPKEFITFVIYSVEGTFCLSSSELGGEYLSFSENGIIKIKKPILIEYFGNFELTDNFLKTRKRNKTPYKEWYDYLNGTIKNDTIFFTEKFVGQKYEFKKKWTSKTRKANLTEIYQPNLSVTKYINKSGIVSFTVTGELNSKRNLEEEKVLELMDKVKY